LDSDAKPGLMSAVVKPVTGSLNLNVTSAVSPGHNTVLDSVMLVSVGGVRSTVTVRVVGSATASFAKFTDTV